MVAAPQPFVYAGRRIALDGNSFGRVIAGATQKALESDQMAYPRGDGARCREAQAPLLRPQFLFKTQ